MCSVLKKKSLLPIWKQGHLEEASEAVEEKEASGGEPRKSCFAYFVERTKGTPPSIVNTQYKNRKNWMRRLRKFLRRKQTMCSNTAQSTMQSQTSMHWLIRLNKHCFLHLRERHLRCPSLSSKLCLLHLRSSLLPWLKISNKLCLPHHLDHHHSSSGRISISHKLHTITLSCLCNSSLSRRSRRRKKPPKCKLSTVWCLS